MNHPKILIVDDKQVNIQILARYLSRRDFEIKTAESGDEALEVIKDFIPEVILMDICMPGMDGIDTVREIKKRIKQNIYVIFITALRDNETKRRAFEVGAASYFNKPVNLKLLSSTINKCLKVKAWDGGGTNVEFSDEDSLDADGLEPEERALVQEEVEEHDNRLLHFSKLKDLGQLSSSIAHDINNFLGGILGNVSLIELSTGDDEILACCSEIKKAVSNTSDLTEALTSYSKKNPVSKKVFGITDTLNDAINLIERDARYNASLIREIDNVPMPVDGVYSELTNIFLNILKNAYQAVDGKGEIVITGQVTEVKSSLKLVKSRLSKGRYACIGISDNGKGIKPDVLKHIFEPFFTTKAEGTGLGLSSALKYLENNGGSLDIESSPGNGTTVTLYFPISSHELTKSDVGLKRDRDDVDLNGKRFVIADDDIIFCNSLTGFLKKHNGRVISFTDENFNVFMRDNPTLEGYDFLLVDFQSPFFNSIELIEDVSSKNQNIQSYIISGSKVDIEGIDRCGAFRKPLSFTKMAQKILQDSIGK